MVFYSETEIIMIAHYAGSEQQISFGIIIIREMLFDILEILSTGLIRLSSRFIVYIDPIIILIRLSLAVFYHRFLAFDTDYGVGHGEQSARDILIWCLVILFKNLQHAG